MADIHHETVDLQHPDHRVVVHAAGQRPVRVKVRILSIVRIAFDFPWPVLSATPNALSMAVSFM